MGKETVLPSVRYDYSEIIFFLGVMESRSHTENFRLAAARNTLAGSCWAMAACAEAIW
jgi:hypothetical protein